MFGAHPELLDGIFNRGNQARGEQQQSLAGSVATFATALVETPPRTPESLLRRIAHKHASLGINADQYQVVHDNLMWAIVDVLGDAVTPEVAAAWDEVYWLMANALINQERGLYSARGVRPDRCIGRGRCRARSARPRTSSPSSSAGSTTGWSRARCPGSTSPSRCSCPTASTSPASTA